MALIKYSFLYRSDSNDVLISTTDGQWSAIVSPLNQLEITNDILNVPISPTSFINLHFSDVDTINTQTPLSLGLTNIVNLTQYLNANCFNDTQPISGGTISGVSGSGFIGFNAQNVTPTVPTSGFKLYANNSNALSWIGQNGFTRTFDGTSNTANRTYVLPNNNGTIALTSDLGQYAPINNPIFSGSVIINSLKASSAITNGITYVGTTGLLEVDPNDLVWDDVNKRLGIFQSGSVPSASLDVHGTTTNLLQVSNVNLSQSVSGGSGLIAVTNPSVAIVSGSRIGFLTFGGSINNSGSTVNSVALEAFATENFASGSVGSNLVLSVTKNGTGVRNKIVEIASNGGVNIASNISMVAQSSNPSTPTNGFSLFASSSGLFSWKGTNGFVRTFDGTANTADRAYVLPDASGTFGLLEKNQTWGGINTFSSINSNGNIIPVTDNTYSLGSTSSMFQSLFIRNIIANGASDLLLNAGTTGGNIAFRTSGTTKFAIFNNGNVVIGTSPVDDGNKLQVNGNASLSGNLIVTNNIYSNNYRSNAGGTILIGSSGGSNYIGIPSTGNILINASTDAGYKLDVNGTGRFVGDLTTGNVISSGTLTSAKLALSTANNGGFGSTTSGLKINLPSYTNIDATTTSSGTVAHNTNVVIGQPTLNSTNTGVTNTIASNVYIAGSPIAGTNTTITNPYALYVNSGNSYFGGELITGGTNLIQSGGGFVMQSGITPKLRPYIGSTDFELTNNVGTTIMRLNNNGNVGIGTTAPTSTLHTIGSQAGTLLSTSTATTLAGQRFIIVTAGVAITLPSASTCSGRFYTINARAVGVTISSYFDLTGTAQTTITMGTSIVLISDGTNWQRVE